MVFNEACVAQSLVYCVVFCNTGKLCVYALSFGHCLPSISGFWLLICIFTLETSTFCTILIINRYNV
jgi:hypothetical protein